MKHIHNPKRQYCSNVILKVNAKLGGANLYLPSRHLPFVSDRPTVLLLSHLTQIIIGADVNHPAVGDNLRPSFASVIASMDARATRYAASLRAQGPRVEIISDLESMVQELFKVYPAQYI
jgi:Piwi domain